MMFYFCRRRILYVDFYGYEQVEICLCLLACSTSILEGSCKNWFVPVCVHFCFV